VGVLSRKNALFKDTMISDKLHSQGKHITANLRLPYTRQLALANCWNCTVANQPSICVEKVSYNVMFFCLFLPLYLSRTPEKNGTWHPETGTCFTTTS